MYTYITSYCLSGISAIAIAAGGRHTCVILTGNSVKCWGLNRFNFNNGNGQVGVGQNTWFAFSPLLVAGFGHPTPLLLRRE